MLSLCECGEQESERQARRIGCVKEGKLCEGGAEEAEMSVGRARESGDGGRGSRSSPGNTVFLAFGRRRKHSPE